MKIIIQNKIPKKLYHATPIENAGSILINGLLISKTNSEQLFLCDHPDNCTIFMYMYGIKSFAIIEVDTTKLQQEYLTLSDDHNKEILKFECYSYEKDINNEDFEFILKVEM